jgi:hypothetical protein
MKKSTTLLWILVMFTSGASAQSGDWRAVQDLPAGTRLKIKLKHGRTFGHCDFAGASDDTLRCDYPGPRYISAQYRRDNIKAVYLTHNARLIGFGIGAASGVIIGAAATPGPAAGRELFAVIDGTVLGGVGYFFGTVADPFFHGKAIYRSPGHSKNNQGQPATHTPEVDPKPAHCLRDGVTMQCVDP